jgi:multidrug resistance efflux pump
MKKKKVTIILIISIVTLAIILIFSYLFESRSVKLPAVVRSDKVFISAQVDGMIKEFYITTMQEVHKNDPLVQIENEKLPLQLQTLKNELNKYREIITSAQSGDYLNYELLDLEADIQSNKIDLEEARLELQKIRDKLEFMRQRFLVAQTQFEANKKLYQAGLINNSEFEKATDDYWDVYEDYFDLKGDSLLAMETMQTSQSIIKTLQERKKILSQNTNKISAKYELDMIDVLVDINELEEEIKNLHIVSPINGVVTDINFRPGEGVEETDVILEIADLSNVWIIAYGDSQSKHRISKGQKVRIRSGSGKKIWGKVISVSPVMEKVTSLSTSFETVNTYSKIEIAFDDMEDALNYITPGERLFVRIYH